MKREDRDKERFEKAKNESNDVYNRSFIGAPAIGGVIVMGIIILYVLYDMFLK